MFRVGIPSTPYSRCKQDDSPLGVKTMETLHLKHPGHTFDLEWDFNTGGG